jgi:alginate O-acetyltransferase complex protein AlgI
MFVPSGLGLPETVSASLTNAATVMLLVGLAVVLLPGSLVLGRVLEDSRSRRASAARLAVMAVAAPYAAVLVAVGTFSPFLYYQF